MNSPDISIVVCTQNRAAMLRGALASLYDLATEGFSYEVVVVDNGSTDTTQGSIATAATESKNPLRGVFEGEKGIVPARNRGIREAKGNWIAFFDDDQLADSRWLAELYRGAAAKSSRVVGGAVHLVFPGGCEHRELDPTVRMLLGETCVPGEPQRYGRRLTPGCGNLMIERSVFEEVGVFQRTVDGRGEDTDLFSRIEQAGIESWYFPSAIVQHLTPPERLEEAYLLSLARRMGAGIAKRQAAWGRARFVALWLAKAARAAVVQAPLAAWAKVRGDYETWLGRRCLLAINASFLRGQV